MLRHQNVTLFNYEFFNFNLKKINVTSK